MQSVAGGMRGSLASGAHPTATFPCDHLFKNGSQVLSSTNWSAPQRESAIVALQEAVEREDWSSNFADGKTKLQVNAEWSASATRCAALQCLCKLGNAKRVLEIGSFCGVATLAMAETLPEDGQIASIELDPFLIEFGQRYHMKSQHHHKIHMVNASAKEALENICAQARDGILDSFDFVLIDADKTSMMQYFELLHNAPGLLSEKAIVCVDMTPFKGQPPMRYTRFGQADKWEIKSGQEEIDALRKFVTSSLDFTSYEFSGLLVVKMTPGRVNLNLANHAFARAHTA